MAVLMQTSVPLTSTLRNLKGNVSQLSMLDHNIELIFLCAFSGRIGHGEPVVSMHWVRKRKTTCVENILTLLQKRP